MPLNDIIADVDTRPDHSRAKPPEANNAPVETPAETTMRTGQTARESRMLPPYLHIQRVPKKSSLLGMGALMVLFLSQKLGQFL